MKRMIMSGTLSLLLIMRNVDAAKLTLPSLETLKHNLCYAGAELFCGDQTTPTASANGTASPSSSTTNTTSGRDTISTQVFNIDKSPELVEVRTEDALLILEFDDGRSLSALLATPEMAARLASIARGDAGISVLSDKDTDDLAKKVADLKELATTQQVEPMREKLADLDDTMKGLDIKQIKMLTSIGVEKLADIINNPQQFNGEDGIDGTDGKDGKDGISVTGPAGNDGRDGRTGETGDEGEKGDQGDTGFTGAQGITGETGQDGEAGVSVIGAYFNTAGELIFQLSQGVGELNVGEMPVIEHTHQASSVLVGDKPLDQYLDEMGVSDVYQRVKMTLIIEVGTGFTLPSIDKAVAAAKDAGIEDFDLVYDFAINQLVN